MKKALLARPSSLIVDNMRRFMTTLGLEPTRLSSADQMVDFSAEEVGCVVVSTALTSTVQEPYFQIIMRASKTFPGKPIFVASFADIKRSKVIVEAKFQEKGCRLRLLTMEEAASHANMPFETSAILITNGEIKEEPVFSRSVTFVKQLLEVPA